MDSSDVLFSHDITPEPSPRLPPFEHVLANNDVVDRIFSLGSPATISHLGWTSRTTHALVKSYVKRAWNVDHHLGHFFFQPRAFRALQARTGTLVSGSNALQFFDRSYYPGSDLDLYLHCGREREVGAFLLAEGYAFRPSRYQGSDFMKHDGHLHMRRDERPYEYPKYLTPHDFGINAADDAT